MKTVLFASMAVVPAVALAGDVDMRYVGSGAGQNVKMNLSGNARDVFAGELMHEISSAGPLNGIYTTYCPDPTEVVAGDFTNYSIENIEDLPLLNGASAPMGAVKANAIRGLFFAEQNQVFSGALSNAYAAAFQLTIWEIVVDFDGTGASLDVAAGNLLVTETNGAVLNATVQGHLSDLRASVIDAISADEFFLGLIGLGNEGKQDQIVIPAPGGLALLGLGALAAGRRRR